MRYELTFFKAANVNILIGFVIRSKAKNLITIAKKT